MKIFAVHARRYAALGWAVFPLAAGSKVPIAGSNGFKSASTDPSIVAALARRYPAANIGVATGKVSGLIVIDIDPRNGGDKTSERLARLGKVFPETVESATCQSGRHLYYAHHLRLKADARKRLGPGIDVKSDGGYVVAPPSVWHKNGRLYRWLRPPQRALLPPLPDWIIDALAPRAKPRVASAHPPARVEIGAYRRQALAHLSELAVAMAGLADGRHQAPFQMACRIGAYQCHGLLSQKEVVRAFLNACACNGALGKYARADLVGQIKNGLRRAANDALPMLERAAKTPRGRPRRGADLSTHAPRAKRGLRKEAAAVRTKRGLRREP